MASAKLPSLVVRFAGEGGLIQVGVGEGVVEKLLETSSDSGIFSVSVRRSHLTDMRIS